MPPPGSAGIGADVPHSASAIVAGTVTGHHLLHVEGYSRTKEEVPNGECVKSRPFVVGDRSWRIWYYPNGFHSGCAKFISIFLCLDESVAEPFKAQAEFSLLDQAGEPVQWCTCATALREYSGGGAGYGIGEFIEREFLEKSEHLVDDCLKIRCNVIISEGLRTEDRAGRSLCVGVPPSDLNQHLCNLLMTKDGADVTFQVADEAFSAHRFLLAARSPVFKAQLLGVMKESTITGDCVRIDDMLPQVFKALLHFIYTDSLLEMEGQEEAVMAQHLLEAADRFDMQRLKLICENKLCSYLDVSTAATTLVLAEQHCCHGLKEACIRFLRCPRVLEAVMATDGFEHLTRSSPALVKELMSKIAAR